MNLVVLLWECDLDECLCRVVEKERILDMILV